MALFNNNPKFFPFRPNQRLIQQSHLQVKTDLNAVAEVLQWFEQFAMPLLPHKFWQECQIALVEGFTNAVRHAHRHLPETTPIDLELKVFVHCLEMRIWDHGQPFDLQAKLQAKLQALSKEGYDPLDDEEGRGLVFMQQLTNELSYERLSDQRNCLLMRKHR